MACSIATVPWLLGKRIIYVSSCKKVSSCVLFRWSTTAGRVDFRYFPEVTLCLWTPDPEWVWPPTCPRGANYSWKRPLGRHSRQPQNQTPSWGRFHHFKLFQWQGLDSKKVQDKTEGAVRMLSSRALKQAPTRHSCTVTPKSLSGQPDPDLIQMLARKGFWGNRTAMSCGGSFRRS